MNAPAEFASPESGDEIKANVRMIAEEIRDRDLSSEFDKLRKLPEDIVDKLRLAGVFRMNMPESWGGPELNPMDQIEIIETLSWGDASVGWCSFIWADSGIYSGYIEDDVARELYPELDLAQSGWVYPGGRRVRSPSVEDCAGQARGFSTPGYLVHHGFERNRQYRLFG